MKTDLVTNVTVVNDAIRFVSQQSNSIFMMRTTVKKTQKKYLKIEANNNGVIIDLLVSS